MQIETAVPLPLDFRKRRGAPLKWDFAKLSVGDSFPLEEGEKDSVRVVAGRYRRRNPGWNFCMRKDGARHRFWRTA